MSFDIRVKTMTGNVITVGGVHGFNTLLASLKLFSSKTKLASRLIK